MLVEAPRPASMYVFVAEGGCLLTSSPDSWAGSGKRDGVTEGSLCLFSFFTCCRPKEVVSRLSEVEGNQRL